MAVPGQAFGASVRVRNSGDQEVSRSRISAWICPKDGKPLQRPAKMLTIAPGKEETAQFRVTVPENAAYTRPYWHRNDPETEGLNIVDDARYATLAFPPSPLHARVDYTAKGLSSELGGVGTVAYKDSAGHEKRRALAVGPPFSIAMDPVSQVIPVGQQRASDCESPDPERDLRKFLNAPSKLPHPPGWQVSPTAQHASFSNSGEVKTCEFQIVPTAQKEGRFSIKASLEYQGKTYSDGYSVVTRDDLDTFYYYQPAMQKVSVVDVKVPNNMKIGYIMGAGDEIPEVLREVGLDVTLIPAEKVAIGRSESLRNDRAGNSRVRHPERCGCEQQEVAGFRFRRWDAARAVRSRHRKLQWRIIHPYPASLGRGRVSVEEAPVQILAPDNRIFHFPNADHQRTTSTGGCRSAGCISWTRGTHKFIPLLASHDPGEKAISRAACCVAQYGKGTYIYTGYAFFRQLPAGVPGAVRLYVNLLSCGTRSSRQTTSYVCQ